MNLVIDKILEYVDVARSRGLNISRRNSSNFKTTTCFMMAVQSVYIPPYIEGNKWIAVLNKKLGTNFSTVWFRGFFFYMSPDEIEDLQGQEKSKILASLATSDALDGQIFARDLIAEYLARGGTFID